MFEKILIANRGEIACRVMRTANTLGAHTVAVYSDADHDAMHVAMADEAWHIGPAAVAESYLRIDRIIDVALRSGARAIHPGYGFLSENPEFVEACEGAGIVFIGPSADSMRAMGLKDAAKKLMEKAGVPVVPGYHGNCQDARFLAARAGEIGYPVLIKARAGGGGKGMRRVETPEEFQEALASARREAQSSFGDGDVLIEKYILSPRHIEIQVFGDQQGNLVYLFERDCSLQRRHQKVIEEAPAPGMREDMRRAMGDAAVSAARAVNYTGAGTVEFIVDTTRGLKADRFYFMEMNTRLQVEHPVTEAISGQDLVEWQLRVAAGENLPLSQDQLTIDGHAFEARIYAEDANRGFLPATGTLKYLSLPGERVRIDTGVREGDSITPFYDPMIAKLIVHGPNRDAALNMLNTALGASHVSGCITNIGFLGRLARHSGFRSGTVDTDLIERDFDDLVQHGEAPFEAVAIAALVTAGFASEPDSSDPWDVLSGWRHFSSARQHIHLTCNDILQEIDLTATNRGDVVLRRGHHTVSARIISVNGNKLRIDLDGHIIDTGIYVDDSGVTVFVDGETWNFGLPDHLVEGEDSQSGEDLIRAPMPGQIVRVSTAKGDDVKFGDTLVVMEAMKMEQTLSAPRDGEIAEVTAKAGEQVEEGAILVRFQCDNSGSEDPSPGSIKCP